MEQAIRDFARQFAFTPEIAHRDKLAKADWFILAGMGGSHLAGDILLARKPERALTVWSDYGLPKIGDPSRTLVIASSYSGNTEETLDAFSRAASLGYNLIAITAGGELLKRAYESRTPSIQLPAADLQPRAALGFSLLALAHAMGERECESELRALQGSLLPDRFEEEGKRIARQFLGRVPIIYSSARNFGIVYNWKIKFNETGKIPAFCNVIPELNHNEMNGFDATDATRDLCRPFSFIFIESACDDPRVQKRMRLLGDMYAARGISVETVRLPDDSFLAIFSCLLVADWAAFYTAKQYERDPEAVPMIAEFKARMRK